MTAEGARKSDEGDLKSFYWGFLAIGVIIGLIIGIAVGGSLISGTQRAGPATSHPNELTPEAAGERAIEFITVYARYALPAGIEISLLNVTELETGNLYKVTTNLTMQGQSETQELYITRDGQLLFPGAINIDEFIAAMESQGGGGVQPMPT